MSSLHLSLFSLLLTSVLAENTTLFFTKSSYDLWCQENLLSNGLFLYSDRVPLGIPRSSSIKSVTYQLLDDETNGLFQVKARRVADFYFLILNLTRPFDINREYQDVYRLRVQATLLTAQENQTEQVELRVHVADSNDNDGVFDMDVYEQNYTRFTDVEQALVQFHASDADEIQHAQILYELASSLNETFSLHPFTGQLYLLGKENLQSRYEFDVFAYDRYRKRFVDNNMKTKTHVKLNFAQENLAEKSPVERYLTIANETVEVQERISSYEIKIFERKRFHLLNMHQPILTIDVQPRVPTFQLYILNNSSSNARQLFVHRNDIYFNRYAVEEYQLYLLICFERGLQCQTINYRYLPWTDLNFSQFHFQPIESIEVEDNLPVDAFLTRIQLDSTHLHQPSLMINYKLLNDEKHLQFYLHSQTGILRLAERLPARVYHLDIQANIQLFNRRYSIETTLEIHVREMNKHPPRFANQTPTEFVQLPYQFQAVDLDQNQQTNGRVTYRLGQCSKACPFQLDPNNGTLTIRSSQAAAAATEALFDHVYDLEIIAFDWGEPISLASRLQVRVDLTSKSRLLKRDLARTRAYSRRWKKKSTIPSIGITTSTNTMIPDADSSAQMSPHTTNTVYLNIGFTRNITSYYLSEAVEVHTIMDRLTIEHDAFPLTIDDETDNLFFYNINDTNVPFIIDQRTKTLLLIDHLDREKQNQYIFEIELKLKSIYATKLQEDYHCQNTTRSGMDLQYTTKYHQKMSVIVYVQDVNDNIPQCTAFHAHLHLNENEKKSNLFQVQAFDPDLGENGTIIYSLLDQTDYFAIDPSSGRIDCIQPIDREQISSMDLHIIASDRGLQPQLQSICMTVHVTIVDVNDNVPRFSSKTYVFELFFDMPRYAVFGQIHADDIDENDRLTYTIDPNPYVTINTNTGHLRLKHNLHRLMDQILNITVKVSDGQHVSQTSVDIRVKSSLDAQQPILLPEPAYAVTINESLPVNVTITNIYRRLQISSATIDFLDIITEEYPCPFFIDQQGSLRLSQSLIGAGKLSYWLPIRLTRYRAHPPHSYVHVHIAVRPENFYLPQCLDIYQDVRVYDYAVQYPFARVQGVSLNRNSALQYKLIEDDPKEKIFSIDQQTGFLHLLPIAQSQRRLKADSFLTVQAIDTQYRLSTDCYVKVHLIRRRQLVPRFIQAPQYQIDLVELDRQSGRLRQRLFQIIALLEDKVYDRKLEIRYRMIDANPHFIINRQTGYIAAKQPLKAYSTYEFTVEAFTVAHRDDILPDGNEQDDDENSNRSKGRVVSARINLPVKIRILPKITLDKSSLSTVDSTINIDLLSTTEVGSSILQLGINHRVSSNHTQWFILISHIRHTRYFHVDFQTGQLMLLRPIEELLNQTSLIELRINVTDDWINMNTIKVLIRLVRHQVPVIAFAQTDYYSSISKSIPVGVEIARLTIDNGAESCRYSIDAVERIKSKDLFRIHPSSGSVIVNQSLENSLRQTHLLTIVYRCEHNYQLASTQLHVQILDEKSNINQTKKSYRFTRENYLVLFETSLVQNRQKYLMDFQLISQDEENTRIKSDAKILQGDPLGLFSIDSANQSLMLRDESLARSYVYPLNLTIIETSQSDPIYCTVTIFITNVGIHFPCPSYLRTSPYLFTYESLPANSVDLLTGEVYRPYQSMIVRALDPFTPINGEASNLAECPVHLESDRSELVDLNNLDFVFDNDVYQGYINDTFGSSSYIFTEQQVPVQLQTRDNLQTTYPFDVTYHLINQSHSQYFQLDEYAGLVKYHSLDQLFSTYSLLIVAQYKSLLTFTRLNIDVNRHDHRRDRQALKSIYEFKIVSPIVNNLTIGFLNQTRKNFTILNEQIVSMITIEPNGRLAIRNRTLILTNGNFYDFLLQDEYLQIARIQLVILPAVRESTLECHFTYFNPIDDRQLVGYIDFNRTETSCDRSKTPSFQLVNYPDVFQLNRDYGLLSYRDEHRSLADEVLLLVEIDHWPCLLNVHPRTEKSQYLMVRNGSDFQKEMKVKYGLEKSTDQLKLANETLLDIELISNRAPIFAQKSYQFSLNITKKRMDRILLGQLAAQPYDRTRSHLVYQLTHPNKHFRIDVDQGQLEYIANEYYNRTREDLQIRVRDLIFHQDTTVNVTIHTTRSDQRGFAVSPIYYRTISEILPPGSLLFQSNLSRTESLEYSLINSKSNLFDIDSTSGDIRLLNALTEPSYALQMRVSPWEEISVIKFLVEEYNDHPPEFLNLPSNLSVSSSNDLIVKLSAHDLDLNDNQRLRYYLLDGDSIVTINSTNGLITRTNRSGQQNPIQLRVAVSDGLYVTKKYLQIHQLNFSMHSPKFASPEYFFSYDQSTEMLGTLSAHDADPSDRVTYELHLAPSGVHIDASSGVLTLSKGVLFQPSVEFFASASDLADQRVYTKIILTYLMEPKFDSSLYFVALRASELKLPMEIFELELVDSFHQPLPSTTRFQLDHQSNLWEIRGKKLILKEDLTPLKNYRLNINGFWRNATVQTSVEIRVLDNVVTLPNKTYRFNLDTNDLRDRSPIHKFLVEKMTMTIVSTPLTRNDCTRNFLVEDDQLFFRSNPIVSDICFFEIQFSDSVSIQSSQIHVAFLPSYSTPNFSSNVYRFNLQQKENLFRVFARTSNRVLYQLQSNPYGLIINQTTGTITWRYHSDFIEPFDRVQLTVDAIDEKTLSNQSASIEFSWNDRKHLKVPSSPADIPLCRNQPTALSDQSLPGTVIQDIRDSEKDLSNSYYIFSGDTYGLFALNNLGQLYLTSSMLNRTSEEYYSLIILVSSLSSHGFCRTNVSIIRTPRWSEFVCPPMPIEWMMEEESSVGTMIGTVKDRLAILNNASQWLDRIRFKVDSRSQTQAFLLNPNTGVLTSNARLDYEQKSSYSFSILLEPDELNCSLSVVVQLLNINDNPVVFNPQSLSYNVTENNPVPMYVGRIGLIDVDQLLSSDYEFYLKNETSLVSVDLTTGSIILNAPLDREVHGRTLIYEIIVRDQLNKEKNLTTTFNIDINDVNDNGPKFSQEIYAVNVSKSLRPKMLVFQVNATSEDPSANGNMTYSLLNPSEYFLLEGDTGRIYVKKPLPSLLTNFTLDIRVMEEGIQSTDRTQVIVSIVNDDHVYFNFDESKACFLREHQAMQTAICTLGKTSDEFLYQVIDPTKFFEISPNNGTLINRKVFDYETDPHEYHLTVIAKDRDNLTSPVSSLNITVYLININDHRPELTTENMTRLVFLYYPSLETMLHQIQVIDKDQSNLTFELIDSSSFYALQSSFNSSELRLRQSITQDREDHLIIRIWDEKTLSSSSYIDLHLQVIFVQRDIVLPEIIPQVIDGYISFEDNSSTINFGPLIIANQSQYPFIYYNLLPNEHFFLKQISSNQTELHLRPIDPSSQQNKARLIQFQVQLTAIALQQSIPNLALDQKTKLYLPPKLSSEEKVHSIDIHLWSIDREMLDRTLSVIINLNSQSTYEQFLVESLPFIRENLAQLVGVQLRHVHVYTLERKAYNQLELLLAIIRHPSRLRPPRYIHKKLLYNVLKNSTRLFETIVHVKSVENILISQCQTKSCENNGRCTSHLKLITHQYEYFSSHHYQRLIPKYQWNIKCLCLNYYHGTRCQLKQDYQSPCSSSPCSATERCIEESSTLYTCQCIDEPCQSNEILFDKTYDCMNINSPTCRDSSNTLTFDGYSYVRMNLTMNLTQHTNLSFTFRSQVIQGKLVSLVSVDERKRQHRLAIQVVDGHVNLELNEKILFQINEISIHDGLWHTIYFSIDYSSNNQYYYYLMRLDQVFSNRVQFYQSAVSNRLEEFVIGNDFHGCLGNITLNNQTIYLQKQRASSQKNTLIQSMEHIGTNDGCQLAEMETRTLRQYSTKEDLCASYHPCYHGGVCASHTRKNGLSFTCNCLKPRFAGRQCQLDLQPCQQNPCLFDEQCIPVSSQNENISYSCISSLLTLPISTRNPLYIGLAVTLATLILFVLLFLSLILYCQQERKEKKRKDHFQSDKPLVSAPLLIQKSSPTVNTIESPMQTLLKLNQHGKHTVETMALIDTNSLQSTMNNFNEKQVEKSSQPMEKHQSQESLNPRRNNDSKGYSTIERMNIPPDNFLRHYNTIDYDNTRVPLVDPQATDLFDFPSSPTKYFNGHTTDAAHQYQVRINSLSDLREKLAEQNDIELTQSSNDSSNNEQTLLTSPVANGERKRRSIFNAVTESTQNIRSSTNSLTKAPVYAKIIKTTSKPSNGGMSTIERLRLSGSPLRLLSSSPTYARTTSFLKSNGDSPSHLLSNPLETDLFPTSSPMKTSKLNVTSWKLNPRKLDSLKARRNSRQTDDEEMDEGDDDAQHLHSNNQETSQLTTTTAMNRLRHASESDLNKEHAQGRKASKLSSFFQTEV